MKPSTPDADEGGNAVVRLRDRTPHQGVKSSAPALAPYAEIAPELAEALRSIVNRYELRIGRLPKVVATVAADAGDGVTTVSQALATLIAQETGRFVCWVDCSWLGGDELPADPDQPGLLEILADDSQITRAFRTSADLPQLVSMSPGPVPPADRNKIVRSPEFEELLDVLSEEFDHVIFDLPPLLTHANALALVRMADASLLVVRHRSTATSKVRRVVESMAPTPNIGVVVNRYRSRIPAGLRRLLEG